MRLERSPDIARLARGLTLRLLRLCEARQAEGGIATIMLTGGTTARAVLQAWAAEAPRCEVDWGQVRLLWSDERWVPRRHEDRNDRLAEETILRALPFDPGLVQRMPSPDNGVPLRRAAADYARIVDGVERIDVAINGLGEDGHIASIFPGSAAGELEGARAPSVVAVPNSPKPPSQRVSVTLPAISRADRVWLLATGHQKARVVASLVGGSGSRLPAARVSGRLETVLWVDEAAQPG